MSKELDKHAALCQSLALAARQELSKDFENVAVMIRGIAADLERTRVELTVMRATLEAAELKKAIEVERKAVARASAAKAKAKPESQQESTPAAPASNAMLFFVRQLVDDVEGFRSSAVEDLPDADAVRTLAETASKNERNKLLALAENWSGNGSELFPADWRVLGRVAWKQLGQERQDAIRVAFKTSRTNADSA